MEFTLIELLTAFEIDINEKGGADFAELVLRLVNHYRWTGERAKVGAVVRSMSRERGITDRQLYMRMKKAVRNILNSDAAALKLWEIYPEKFTSSMLAAAIAEREIQRIEQRQK